MPRQETITILKFDELQEGAKTKVLEKHRFYEVEGYDWWDRCDEGLLEPDTETIKKLNLQLDEHRTIFQYAISAFDLDSRHYLQLKDIEVNDDKSFMKMLGIPVRLWEYTYYKFNNGRGETNTELIIELDLPDDWEKPEIEQYLQYLADLYYDRAKELWDEMMERAWRSLRNDYEYLISDEAVGEMLIANEYEFTEDGEVWRR